MNILIIAAHPDDEVLGCGGTVTKLVQEGHDVYIAILGEGVTSRYEEREQAENGLVESIRACSQQVAQNLGVKDLILYSLPDNRFDTVPLLDVVKVIEKLLGSLRPQVLYTHSGGDLNIDHQITFRAVMTAARPIAEHPVKEIYSFEIASSTEWAFQQLQRVFRPNVFVDIAATIETKLQCMEIYESEARTFPHPRSSEALRVQSRRWGSVVGLEYAEAFELIRSVKV